MNKKYIVRLTDEERAICEVTIKKETGKSEKLRRATILLKADADGPAWDDAKISEAVGCRTRTAENVRQAFVLEGFEGALVRKQPATSPTPKLLDGAAEAKLIALRFAEPLAGFRQATARPRRTKDDWAQEVAHLLDTRYAGVERITLVCDNLNTHTKGAFYEAFPPDQARDYVRRIDFVYTPKHGSWLNVAECELSCMTSQCLKDRRIGDLETLQTEIAAWSTRVNKKQRAVDWQFTIAKARGKLKRLYPKI